MFRVGDKRGLVVFTCHRLVGSVSIGQSSRPVRQAGRRAAHVALLGEDGARQNCQQHRQLDGRHRLSENWRVSSFENGALLALECSSVCLERRTRERTNHRIVSGPLLRRHIKQLLMETAFVFVCARLLLASGQIPRSLSDRD